MFYTKKNIRVPLSGAILWLLFLGTSPIFSDVLILSSGEKLTGEIISQDKGVIVFKHPVIGQVNLPADKVTIEAPALAAQGDAAQAASADQAVAKADAAVQKTETSADAAGGTAAPDGQNAQDSEIESSIKKWRKQMLAALPAGMDGKLTLGYNYLNSGDSSEALDIGFLTNYKKDAETLSFLAYYNYATSKSTSGVRTTSADKYGASLGYRHDINERWFVVNDLSYLHDQLLQINHQGQDVVSLGYTFLKTKNLTWAVTAGPSARYTDAVGLSSHWFGLGVFGEELNYKLTETLAFKQLGSYSIDPSNSDNYAWSFYAGFTLKVTDWMDASLAYSYLVNNMVGPQAQNYEERIIFALGFPF